MSLCAPPPEVCRIASWLTRILSIDEPDAISIAWEAVWRHGSSALAPTEAHRRGIDQVRRDRGRDTTAGPNALRPAPLLVGMSSPPSDIDQRSERWWDGLIEPVDDPGYAEAEDRADVAALLRTIDPRYRRLLTRVYLDGLGSAEVARQDGVTESAVCHRLRKAEAAVRKAVGL